MPNWIPYVLLTAAYLVLCGMDSLWSAPTTETDTETDQATGEVVTETRVTYEHWWTLKRMNLYRIVAIILFLAGTVCVVFL